MGGPFHFEEDTGFQALEFSQSGDHDLVVGAEPFELNLLFEAITGDIGSDALDHGLNGRLDGRFIGPARQGEHCITHDHGWLSGIEHDDGLPLGGAAHRFDAPGGGLCKFINIRPCARPRRL